MVGGVKTGTAQNAITALGAVAQRLDPENLPNRIQLFAWGENPSDKGAFTVDSTTLSSIRDQIAGEAHKRVVIDFDHQSDPNSPTFVPSPRHHAGYGDVEVVEGEGVFLSSIDWTPKGREYAPDYMDVSPVAVHTRKDRVVLGIKSVSLVPNGSLHGRTLFSADADPQPQQEIPMADSQTAPDAQKPEEAMAAMAEEIKALKSQLEAALAEVGALREKVEAKADEKRPDPAVEALSAKTADQGQQISTLAAALDAQRKETMVQLAAAQGKAVALGDAAITALSVEDLAAHIRGIGATVPMHRQTPMSSAGEASTTCLAAQQNALMAQIRKETGETRFEALWAAAKGRSPELFR